MSETILTHSVCIADRMSGAVEGVTKVVSAYPDAINLLTSKGGLTLTGKNLKILKFDVGDGSLKFEGEVTGLKYDAPKKPLLKRLFK